MTYEIRTIQPNQISKDAKHKLAISPGSRPIKYSIGPSPGRGQAQLGQDLAFQSTPMPQVLQGTIMALLPPSTGGSIAHG